MTWQAPLADEAGRHGSFAVPAHFPSGQTIGIVTVDLDYPKLPGNVANATTFDYPVRYEKVEFEIERLFAGDPSIEGLVIDAARKLEREGVRAIVGACGFFAHFQDSVAAAVDVPVFMSSLVQAPLIEVGLKPGQKIAVLAADGASVTPELLAHVNARPDRLIVRDIGSLESFAPIRWGKTTLDNGALIADLQQVATSLAAEHPEIGAFLLECSDLPPYAADIQAATGLPVFDFVTLIDWVHQSVAQRPYYGWL